MEHPVRIELTTVAAEDTLKEFSESEFKQITFSN